MDLLNSDDLKALLAPGTGPRVSLFMPTHRAGRDSQQDPIRFRNLLKKAEEHLVARGVRGSEARELLEAAHNLPNEDSFFWQHQSDGLAVFIAPGVLRRFRVPLALPELVVVADRFHLKPLLSLLAEGEPFHILALSQKEVRLFTATRYSVAEVDLGDAPRSLAEALKYDDFEKQLQFHTGTQPVRGERSAMFHGHGAGEENEKEEIFRFFRMVDQGVRRAVADESRPLVLAGVEYLLPIYWAASEYRHLAEEGIIGNPEGLSAEELRERAWSVLEPRRQERRQKAAANYAQLAGGERATDELAKALPAASYGRVETLFVAAGRQQWGRFDPAAGTVEVHQDAQPGDEDLLDTAAVQTILNRGAVYVVPPDQVPGGGVLAAILRY